MTNLSSKNGDTAFHCLADAGNTEALGKLLTLSAEKEGDLKDFHAKQNNDGNTFLHIYAQGHKLKDLFNQILPKSLAETLKIRNYEGKTFLTIAIDTLNVEGKEKQDEDKALREVIDEIARIYGEATVSELCQQTDTKRNNLLHLAGQKSLKRLVSYLLPRTQKNLNKLYQDGHNLLHVAVYKNDAELIHTILNTKIGEKVKVNSPTKYGETALHIAAKQGYLEVLEELIRRGGDLSWQDKDGYTPLHDCLQQVYFEGGDEEEAKCDKFIKVWNKVVEQAVTWWCQKKKKLTPLNNEDKYMFCQIKAVYYLRSCIPNNDGLSVLQYAADRGLVRCVHTMLAAKAVFAIADKGKTQTNKGQNDLGEQNDVDSTTTLESDFHFKIDVVEYWID